MIKPQKKLETNIIPDNLNLEACSLKLHSPKTETPKESYKQQQNYTQSKPVSLRLKNQLVYSFQRYTPLHWFDNRTG